MWDLLIYSLSVDYNFICSSTSFILNIVHDLHVKRHKYNSSLTGHQTCLWLVVKACYKSIPKYIFLADGYPMLKGDNPKVKFCGIPLI